MLPEMTTDTLMANLIAGYAAKKIYVLKSLLACALHVFAHESTQVLLL